MRVTIVFYPRQMIEFMEVKDFTLTATDQIILRMEKPFEDHILPPGVAVYLNTDRTVLTIPLWDITSIKI